MKFLINGGEFNNKGAESMTLVAISRIREKYPDAKIVMNYIPENNFDFSLGIDYVSLNPILLNRILKIRNLNSLKLITKNLIKFFVRRKKYFSYKKNISSLHNIDFYIDISGYALSSKWGLDKSRYYLNCISAIKKLNPNCKVYLMPQSFGPFDYENKEILKNIKSTLESCCAIYVREKGGYDDLVSLGLTNIFLSPDSVLLAKQYNVTKIIRNFNEHIENVNLKSGKKLAIIPNMRLMDKGGASQSKLLSLYYCIINKYSSLYNCYLIAHAGEDLEICKTIKNHYVNNENIILIDHVLRSFDYENIIKEFDFIIASRYHSIVHAYRQNTPAVIIGWSEKYEALARLFNQEKYIVEIDAVEEKQMAIVDDLALNYKVERENIITMWVSMENHDCYAFLDANE